MIEDQRIIISNENFSTGVNMENKVQLTFTHEISAVKSCQILRIITELFVLEPAPGGSWLVGDGNTSGLVSAQCCTVLYGHHVINLR